MLPFCAERALSHALDPPGAPDSALDRVRAGAVLHDVENVGAVLRSGGAHLLRLDRRLSLLSGTSVEAADGNEHSGVLALAPPLKKTGNLFSGISVMASAGR
jgi:hypothetical protein